MASLQNPLNKLAINKTPLPKQGRNEESCEHGHPIVAVKPVVKPVVVPVPLSSVAIEVPHIAVAVRVAKMRVSPSIPPPFECSQGCIVFEIIIS